MSKTEIINNIINLEGGYANNPDDSGGETNFGITKAVAVANGYTGEMKDLPHHFAFDIYASRYWDSVRADAMPDALASKVVEIAILSGPAQSGKFLQACLNSLNNKGELYDDIAIDGQIGNNTLRAMNGYLKTREVEVLLKGINCLFGAFLIDLSQRRQKDETFVYGWLKNRISL